MRTTELPADLRAALDETMAPASAKGLAAAAQDLSSRYRGGHGHGAQDYLTSQHDVTAYAATRLPATYAAVHAALSELCRNQPGWSPQTVLDVGAGPGTAAWAANNLWPEMSRIVLVEKDERMIALGRQLAGYAEAPALRAAEWRRQDCLRDCADGRFDLVILSYVLGELLPQEIPMLLDKLWALTAGALAIVEPGTPRAFALVRTSRERLITAGAFVLAPCPHQKACPLPADDWCHFAQRVARSRLHRRAKRADLGYEDEKFSYVIAAREPGLPIAARVIRHPQYRPGHVHLELCTEGGIEQRLVSRRDRAAYRQARDCSWGSIFTE